jgi:hypothetical protein
MSGQEFVGRFNALFVRHVPESADEVIGQAADFVVNEMDALASRVQRLDESPQFVEDRTGFTGFQILEAFENEVVKPGIVVRQQEVETYRAEHPDLAFTRDRIAGRKLVFASAKEAAVARDALSGKVAGSTLGLLTNADAAFPTEIAKGAVPVELGPMGNRIFSAKDGTVFGPVAAGSGRWLLFVKDSDVARHALTTAEFSRKARPLLEKHALEREELVLAAKWTPALGVSQVIDAGSLAALRDGTSASATPAGQSIGP